MKLFNLVGGITLKRSVLAGAIAASCATSAFALPAFTFNPATLCAAGATCGSVTADNILVSDFSTVTFAANGTFTDAGYLKVTGFELGAAQVSPAGFNTNYSLYIPFSGTGHVTSASNNFTAGATSGQFDTLNYQFIGATGNANGSSAFNSGTVLASGSLIGGFVGTSPATSGPKFVPTANADVTFNPLIASFFASPNPFYNVALTAFTNTSSEVAVNTNGFTITQGGGSLNFAPRTNVPEPATLALLGVGLLGLGLRRRKQA